jgi:broad specificity phosphatase PhoE
VKTNGSQRRRIYLMRHGSVDYFGADGAPVAASHDVPLNALGLAQAIAAGTAFAQHGVRFDLAIASGLPRTVQTAQRALAAAGQGDLPVAVVPELAEIRGGSMEAIPDERLHAEFVGVFTSTGNVEHLRFMGGESIGELLDRVLPAFEAILARRDWDTLLLVLHGGVNRAIVSRALTGGRAYFGRIEQAPACINIVDVGDDDLILRATNVAPTQLLHASGRGTSMEGMLAQYLKYREVAA